MKKQNTADRFYVFEGSLLSQCRNAFIASKNDRRDLVKTVERFGSLPEMMAHIADWDTESAAVKVTLYASFNHALKWLAVKGKYLPFQDTEDAFMLGLSGMEADHERKRAGFAGLYGLTEEDLTATAYRIASKQEAAVNEACNDDAYLLALADLQQGIRLYTSAVLYELARQFGLAIGHYAKQWADNNEYTTALETPIDDDGNTVADTVATYESREGYNDTRNLNAYQLLREKYDITRREYSSMLEAYKVLQSKTSSKAQRNLASVTRYTFRKKYGIGILNDMDDRKKKERSDAKHDGMTRSQRYRAAKKAAANLLPAAVVDISDIISE